MYSTVGSRGDAILACFEIHSTSFGGGMLTFELLSVEHNEIKIISKLSNINATKKARMRDHREEALKTEWHKTET
jgi:hypothetical protein